MKLVDLGFRAQRWVDADDVVHGWYVHGGFSALPRITFCGLSLHSSEETNFAHVDYPAVLVDRAALYGDIAVTCISCMSNGALEQ